MVLETQPEHLLWVRCNSHNLADATEVMVKWNNLPEYEATWESVALLNARFPDFHHEDKVVLNWPGGIAKPSHLHPILYMYARRKKDDKGNEVVDQAITGGS